MRVLTKSRFKLGLECPNKLFFTKKKEYINQRQEDPFLMALAEGGFQVEELARMHYPKGVLIEGNDWNYELLWEQTKALLKQENVVIYEAAFLIDGLFIRTDVLVKTGNRIELIEVKAKSFMPDDENLFVGKRGGMVSGWKPYLFDIAFQKRVMQMCYPDWKIDSYIMMADKSKTATVNGLNQMFRINKKEGGRTGIVKKVSSIAETGDSVLGRKNVSEILERIELGHFKYHDNLSFDESIELFRELYSKDKYANWPTSYGACKACEFRCSEEEEEQGYLSGYKHCFKTQLNWGDKEFLTPNIFDVHNFHRGNKLFEEGIVFKHDLSEEKIGYKEEPDKLSNSHRQWLQITKEIAGDSSIYVDKEGLKEEMDKWIFPLHFIDFETSAVALPFNKGIKPYEQIAFQFSHHTVFADGSISHANEYINNRAGEFPNFEFIRALKQALSNDEGTIFKYSNHENSILNAIYYQLKDSYESDKKELMDFIMHISHSRRKGAEIWTGARDMVDLCEVEKNFYYNPYTKGSNSIKEVLPASLNSSKFLQKKYSQPIGVINISSKNFDKNHVWLSFNEDGTIINPYKMLPPLFEGWTESQLEKTLSEIEDIANGGAALTAYGKLQYTDMSEAEVEELTKGLLKYCELDTLAMVMIYEHFREITE